MADIEPDPEILRFGAFTLNTRRRDLLFDTSPVKLDARAFDLLVFLISRRAEAVSRDDILKHVFDGRVVDPSNVAVQLSSLRGALTRAGCADPLIVTLPGPRYRFIGELAAPDRKTVLANVTSPPPVDAAEHAARSASPVRRRAGLVMAGLSAVIGILVASVALLGWLRAPPVSSDLSIAVLPFRNIGPDGGNSTADAITDDLIRRLGQIPESTVIARESAQAVKSEMPQQIGRDLRVRYILAGTLYSEGPQFRVMAHLIDTVTGAQLWSTEIQESQSQEQILIEDIVQQIASELHVRLDQLESSRSLHDRPDDPGAIDLFFRARAALDRDETPDTLRYAEDALELAIGKRSDFTEAKAELGWLLLRKVLSIDDQADQDKDWLRADEVINQALKKDSGYYKAVAARARELLMERRYREAHSTAEVARKIEPSSIEAYSVLANCAWMLGQLDAEISFLQEIERLNPQGLDNRHVHFQLGVVRLLKMQPSVATDELLQSIGGDPEPQPGAESLGRAERARAWLIAAYGMNSDGETAHARYLDYDRVWPNRSIWRFKIYLPRAVAEMPSLVQAMKALNQAGMPPTGDATKSVAAGEQQCGSDVFSPTPKLLPGGHVIDTTDVDRFKNKSAKPLILDLGEGVGSIPGANWFDPGGRAETSTEFLDRSTASLDTRELRALPIIVLSDGPFGCIAYNSALHLVSRNFTNVNWYRGGEEAWAASGNKVEDHRPK